MRGKLIALKKASLGVRSPCLQQSPTHYCVILEFDPLLADGYYTLCNVKLDTYQNPTKIPQKFNLNAEKQLQTCNDDT